jgi:hypothetical protein
MMLNCFRKNTTLLRPFFSKNKNYRDNGSVLCLKNGSVHRCLSKKLHAAFFQWSVISYIKVCRWSLFRLGTLTVFFFNNVIIINKNIITASIKLTTFDNRYSSVVSRVRKYYYTRANTRVLCI